MKKINMNYNLKKSNSFTLKTALVFIMLVFINYTVNSNIVKNTESKMFKVVYIIKSVITNETADYGGTLFNVSKNNLVGIITREYYDKNKSKVKTKYPNCLLHTGIVYGNPLVTKNIYVEPNVGDYMQIDTRLLSQYSGSPRLPINCQKKGTKCSINTDTALTVYLYVTEDRWSTTKGYSSRSKYKILKLKSTGSLRNNNYSTNPTRIKFKQSPLITKIYANKYIKY